MNLPNQLDDELREKIAEALELEKGGITDHPSPANEHYYFVNEVEDYETEQLIMTQRIGFEDRIANVKQLIGKELVAELERLLHPNLWTHESRAKQVLVERIEQIKKEYNLNAD